MLCAGPLVILDVAGKCQIFLIGLKRFRDDVELEILPIAAGRPPVHRRAVDRVVHDHSMRKIEEPRAQILRRSCFAQRRGRGDHRIQKGQSQADTGSLQECPAGQVLLSQEHGPNRSAETYWKSSSGGVTLTHEKSASIR